MKLKITSQNFEIAMFKRFLVMALMLFVSNNLFSQITITDVFPTRVTTGSKITVRHNGFVTNPSVSLPGISFTTPIYVSDTEIAFEITRTEPNASWPRYLILGGTSNSVRIEYVGPKPVSLTSDQSYHVKEIYTNWDYDNRDFWSSTFYKDAVGDLAREAASPNNKHELLGFMVNDGVDDIIYSTGVEVDFFEDKLAEFDILTGGVLYRKKLFKAYSTNGVRGKLKSDNFIIAGDMIDGLEPHEEDFSDTQFETITDIKDLTILEAITTGKNGLELGIGVTNFSSQNEIQFFSGNGTPGAVDDDGAPDLLITQIADAQGYKDIYYYADNLGNVVGTPIKLEIKDLPSTELAKWKVNLYKFPLGRDFAATTPDGRATIYIENPFRPLRMAAFKLEDFDITTPEQVAVINNIKMIAAGQADIAFMAYNADSFDIKGPVAKTILPQYVCRLDNNSSSVFTVKVGKVADDGNVGIEDFEVPGNIREEESGDGPVYWTYELWKDGVVVNAAGPNPGSLTIDNIDVAQIGVYKLVIDNGQGSTIVPVELVEGGVPTVWNGATWSSLPYTGVSPGDRNLFFAANYDGTIENIELLEGCDCIIKSDVNVTIGKGKTLKLYNNIDVEGETEVRDENSNVIDVLPAGTFTLQNNASLIQINDPSERNENKGNIIVERETKEGSLKKYDYIYWSSPVTGADLSDISGQTSHVYKWNVTQENVNGTSGDWESASGIMEVGRGYIKRVNNIDNNYADFKGTPNNGPYPFDLVVSGGALPDAENRNWNLIGNPYPSAISADDFLTTNAASVTEKDVMYGGVYLWRHSTVIGDNGDPFYEDFVSTYNADDYLAYNLTAPIDHSFDGFIASGQGFFVKAKNDGDVLFNNAMRYGAGETAYDNTQFYRASEEGAAFNSSSEKQLIWLSLSNESKSATVAVVGYVKGATNGEDNLYDATTMGNGAFSLYSPVNEKRMAIQGRPLPFDDQDQVTLGIAIPKNGIYKIGIDHLKGNIMLNEDQGIYLEDTYNNVIHNLRNSPYGFTATKGDIKDRFVLRYTDEKLSVPDQHMANTFVYVKNNQLYVKASKNIEAVVVYDLTGKRLMDYRVSGSADAINTSFQFPRGVYLTEIKLENAGVVTKKVMN